MHIWGVDSVDSRRRAALRKSGIRRDRSRPLRAFRCAQRRRRDRLIRFSARTRSGWIATSMAGDVRAAAAVARREVSGHQDRHHGFLHGRAIALAGGDSTKATLFAAVAPFYGAARRHRSASDSHAGLRQLRRTRHGHSTPPSVRAFAAALTVPNDFAHLRRSRSRVFRRHSGRHTSRRPRQDAWRRTIAFFTEYFGAPTT